MLPFDHRGGGFESEKAPDEFLQWAEPEAAIEVEAVGAGAFLNLTNCLISI